jgi:hypothetical protein
MQVVPLQPVPNQSVQVQLNGQPCTLYVVQYAYGLFMTVYIGSDLIIASVPCQNLNRIVRSLYLGFLGDFAFYDTQGSGNPVYSGLGDITARYQLLYFDPEELTPI